jgi:hypothetical protein
MLLILDGTHAREFVKMTLKRRNADLGDVRQLFDLEPILKVSSQPRDRLGHSMTLRAKPHEKIPAGVPKCRPSTVSIPTTMWTHTRSAGSMWSWIAAATPSAQNLRYVPSMIAGFKIAIALAVVGAVVGEFVGSRSGLGYYMLLATGNFDTPLVFACVVVLTVMGIALFYAVGLLEIALARWNRAGGAKGAETTCAFGM